MRKVIDPVGVGAAGARRSSLGLAGWAVAIALTLPIAVDLVRVGVNQWRGMLGTAIALETPAIDFAREAAGRVGSELWELGGSGFQTITGRTDYVILALIACVLAGAFVLRRAP